jgi:integrase
VSPARLETARKSESAVVAYRVAIDDLLDWSEPRRRSVLEEATIVDYLGAYQQRAQPAPATYYRRFLLLRRFLRWVCRRDGAPDPFLDLEPPPKPRQERDWLTRDEFRRLLDAAAHPERNLPGLAERDRLALLALVTTGLRRSELCALEWRDLELDGRKRSLLVRRGKGGRRDGSRYRQASSASCGGCATNASLGRPTRSSAGSPADASRRRSSPTSSAAPRDEQDLRSTSPRTRCGTPGNLAPTGAW